MLSTRVYISVIDNVYNTCHDAVHTCQPKCHCGVHSDSQRTSINCGLSTDCVVCRYGKELEGLMEREQRRGSDLVVDGKRGDLH